MTAMTFASPGLPDQYVYALTDPMTGDVRYIGRTEDPDKRLYLHWSSRNSDASARHRWLGSLSEKPGLMVLARVPRGAAGHVERQWIALALALGVDLLNVMVPPAADLSQGFYAPTPAQAPA